MIARARVRLVRLLLARYNPIQGLTARVGEDENRPPFVTSERQRLAHAGSSSAAREYSCSSRETLRRRLFGGWRHHEDPRSVAVLPATVKREVHALPQGSSTYPEGSVIDAMLVATVATPEYPF
jgi:hypothetical protein